MKPAYAAAGAVLFLAAVLLAVLGSSDVAPSHVPARSPMRIELVSGHKLVGRPVRDAAGAGVGSLADVVVEAPSGALCFAVIRPAGETEEAGAALLGVRWPALSLSADPHAPVRLDRPAAALAGAPRLREGDWTPLAGLASAPPDWKAVGPRPGAISPPCQAAASNGVPDLRQPTLARLVSLDQMRGATVSFAQGGVLGRIERVMLDTGRGVIAYVIVSCDPCSAESPPWIALPYTALVWSRRAQQFAAITNPGDLDRRLSLLGRPDWRRGASPGDIAMLYRLFGFPPYWSISRSGTGAAPEADLARFTAM